MQEIYSLIEAVAPTPPTVLVTGESGTGKESEGTMGHLTAACFVIILLANLGPSLAQGDDQEAREANRPSPLAMGEARPPWGRPGSDGFRPSVVSCQYEIDIERPGADRVPVRCRFDGIDRPQLTLALFNRAAPGIEPSLQVYGIHRTLEVSRLVPGENGGLVKSEDVDLQTDRDDRGLGLFFLTIRSRDPEEALGNVLVEYVLDLSRIQQTVRSDPYIAPREFKDRLVVLDDYAPLRGDVLFFPQACTIKDPSFRVRLPDGWKLAVNADRDLDSFVIRHTFPPWMAAASVSWYGLAGRDLLLDDSLDGTGARTDQDGEGVLAGVRRRIIVPRTANGTGISAEQVVTIFRRFISHYDGIFGAGALEYVTSLPPFGSQRPWLYVFGVPYPDFIPHGAGGQYFQGTAYLTYSVRDWKTLLHKGAHEYFHAYANGGIRTKREVLPDGSIRIDSWFVEGYTELMALLARVKLRPGIRGLLGERGDPLEDDPLYQFQLELIRAWSLMKYPDPPPRTYEAILAVRREFSRRGLIRSTDSKNDSGSPGATPTPTGASDGDPETSRLPESDSAASLQESDLDLGAGRTDHPELARLSMRDIFGSHGRYDQVVRGRAFLLAFRMGVIMARGTSGPEGVHNWLKILLARYPLTQGREGPAAGYEELKEAALKSASGARAELEDFFGDYIEGTRDVSLADLGDWVSDDGISMLMGGTSP